MKAKEIRASDKGTLNEKVLEIRKELVKMSSQIASGSALKNPGQVRKLKKTLARIYTIQSEKRDAKVVKEDIQKKHE